MKKLSKKLLIVTAVAAALFSSNSMANIMDQFKSQSGIKPVLPNQFEIAVQGGVGGMELPQQINLEKGTTASENSRTVNGFPWRVAVGYNFGLSSNFTLGPELGYAHEPTTKFKQSILGISTTSQWSAHYVDLLAAAKLNLSSSFVLIGKAGVAAIGQKVESSLSDEEMDDIDGDNKVTRYAPEVVAGIGFNASQNILVSLTYDRVFADSISDSENMAYSPNNNDNNNDKVATIQNVMLGLSLLC